MNDEFMDDFHDFWIVMCVWRDDFCMNWFVITENEKERGSNWERKSFYIRPKFSFSLNILILALK